MNELPPPIHRVFIRPVGDTKAFNAGVVDAAGFETLRGRYPDEIAILAPVRTFHSETRCWVVDGRIVTASLYRRGGQILYSCRDVPPDVLDFAARCIAAWNPSPAYVLDVAETSDGPRIIETNCLSAAGHYDADLQRIVATIEDLLSG